MRKRTNALLILCLSAALFFACSKDKTTVTGDVLPTPSDASPEDADAGVPPAQDATDASSNNADADTTQVDASVGPVLLTPDLCDDPNNMALLMDALATSGEGAIVRNDQHRAGP